MTHQIWALYSLCKDKNAQQKLRDEIRAKIPSSTAEVSAADIDDCHYLQAVCWEVLRLWAPVSLTMRVADRDTTIQGEHVPKGTTIILAPAAINTSTHLWGEDALEFKPERWLNADGKSNQRGGADSNYSFLTFLHGPRSCIGQRFSQYELACMLAAWVRETPLSDPLFWKYMLNIAFAIQVGRYDTSFEEGSPLAKGELEIKVGAYRLLIQIFADFGRAVSLQSRKVVYGRCLRQYQVGRCKISSTHDPQRLYMICPDDSSMLPTSCLAASHL